jgi:hypothetical protein
MFQITPIMHNAMIAHLIIIAVYLLLYLIDILNFTMSVYVQKQNIAYIGFNHNKGLRNSHTIIELIP